MPEREPKDFNHPDGFPISQIKIAASKSSFDSIGQLHPSYRIGR